MNCLNNAKKIPKKSQKNITKTEIQLSWNKIYIICMSLQLK